ncbi:hypothetical protein [uncultured Rikenella sp.]|nr:hypothetical protein [uncultured Rikenella sp.]
MWSLGSNGYSWSSSVSETHGMVLRFPTQNLNPSYAHHRSHGFQLRCLSE